MKQAIFREAGARLILAIILGASLANNVYAHTELTMAMPAENAQISAAPDHINLTFTEDVRLMQLTLLNGKAEKVDLNFVVGKNAMKSHSVALPPIPADRYTVEWAVLGDDGHKVEGKYNFEIKLGGAAMDEVEADSSSVSHQDHSH